MKLKPISSRDNATYKELKHLASSSQACRQAKRTLLDGVHLCSTYLEQIGIPAMCVVSESFLHHHEVAPIVAQCEAGEAQCILLPDALYHAVMQVENGVGIMFMITTPHPAMPAALNQPAVLLDGLQDPGNLGSILRSAAAAGIQNIFCSKGTAFAWSSKVLRAGMGAHFLLTIFENVDLKKVVADATVPIAATSSYAKQSLYEMDLTGSVMWLLGHEGQGVHEDLLASATNQISIPHLGDVESLNVAASAAVCFFEQVRQKMALRNK
jgi:TrmH family RNA methyltransferase